MTRVRKRARLVATEQPVARARHEVVAEVAQPSRHEAQRGRHPPGTTQLAEDPERSAGLSEEPFVRPAGIQDKVERIQVPGIPAVAREDLAGDGTLERREAKAAGRIAGDHE